MRRWPIWASAALVTALLLSGCGPSSPTSPSLTWPPQGDTLTGSEATFTWVAVEGAARYRIEIASDSFFTSASISADTLTGTSFVVDLGFGGPLEGQSVYYWHAAAYNEEWSPWSDASSFYNANIKPPAR